MISFRLVTGRLVDLEALTTADVDPHAIGWALSMLCRFGGHMPVFYSVAQHCVEVSQRMDCGQNPSPAWERELRLAGLLHDAAEGLGLGDIIGPVKRYLARQPEIHALEAKLERAVETRFGLSRGLFSHPLVKIADRACCHREQLDLRKGGAPAGADDERAEELPVGDWERPIVAWSQPMAYMRFMQRLGNLQGAPA